MAVSAIHLADCDLPFGISPSLAAVAGLPLQAIFCGKPMRVGQTVGAAFLVDLVRRNGDFLVSRFEAEIRILG